MYCFIILIEDLIKIRNKIKIESRPIPNNYLLKHKPPKLILSPKFLDKESRKTSDGILPILRFQWAQARNTCKLS